MMACPADLHKIELQLTWFDYSVGMTWPGRNPMMFMLVCMRGSLGIPGESGLRQKLGCRQFHAVRPCEESCWGSISAFAIQPCSRLALVPECHRIWRSQIRISPGDPHRDKSDDRKVCRNYLRGCHSVQHFGQRMVRTLLQRWKNGCSIDWARKYRHQYTSVSSHQLHKFTLNQHLPVGRPWHGLASLTMRHLCAQTERQRRLGVALPWPLRAHPHAKRRHVSGSYQRAPGVLQWDLRQIIAECSVCSAVYPHAWL